MKLVAKIIITLSLLASMHAGAAYAVTTDELLPYAPITDYSSIEQGNPNSHDELITNYQNLPQASLNDIIAVAIRTVLYLAGSLAVIGLLVVGTMFLAGTANEESINSAKKVLGYMGIGILILSVSYALITGIVQIDFFDAFTSE